MKTTCNDLIEMIEKFAPPELAFPGDPIGLAFGSKEKIIRQVAVCVDITNETLEEALINKADMIVSHHPLIFDPIMRFDPEDHRSPLIMSILQNGLCCFSAHSNMDFTKGGINDELAARIGLIHITPALDGKDCRVGRLAYPEPLPDFIERLKRATGTEQIGTIHYDPDAIVNEVAVFCGSPDDETILSMKSKASTIVTGELKHDKALAFAQSDARVAVLGHFASERSFKDIVARLIETRFPEIGIHICEQEKDPVSWVLRNPD